MTLTVTDAAGRKYRPNGQFREPAAGDFLYCFDHKRVEQRLDADGGITIDRMHSWCSSAHVEFLLHRIIVEPLPVEYEVTVRLTAEQFESFRKTRLTNLLTQVDAQVFDAIHHGNYREVSS